MAKVVSNRIYFNFDRHKTKVYGQYYCSCYENKVEYVFLLVEGRKEGSNERRRKSHTNMRKEENDRLKKKRNEENIFIE